CDKPAINRTLSALGERLQLDRVLLRLYEDNSAPVFAEWQAPGVRPISEITPDVRLSKPHYAASIYISDTEGQEYPEFLRELSARAGARAQMILPMLHNGDLHGYLICHSSRPRKWDNLEKRAARTLAEALGMVLIKERIQQQLSRNQHRFQMALDAANYGLWEYNIRERSIALNTTYYSMLAYPPEKANGFRPLQLDNVHFEDRRTLLRYGDQLAKGSIESFVCETRHITGHGDVKWILMRGKTIRWDGEGKPLRAIGIMTDITALKNTHLDLQLAQGEAEKEHRAKSEFL